MVGLLVEGFDSPPTFMMPYNPSYYGKLIEGNGFHKAQDLYAYWGHKDMMAENRPKFQPLSEQIIETIRALRPPAGQDAVSSPTWRHSWTSTIAP